MVKENLPLSNNTREIEKTYLVQQLPGDIFMSKKNYIKQGYLPTPSDSVEIRLRQDNNGYNQTTKTLVHTGDYSQFDEASLTLTEPEFSSKWPQVTDVLEKLRYVYPLPGSVRAEVDLFTDDLLGLMIVEVEFPSEDLLEQFTKPSWFGRDITQERWIAGKNLAGKKFTEVQNHLL